MTKTGWIVAIIVIIVLIGGFLLWSQSASAPAVDTGASTSVPTDTTGTPTTGGTDTGMNNGSATGVDVSAGASVSAGTAPMTATVMYDGKSFSPANVTIAKGGTVTFTDTAGKMWLASDPHPAHSGYDGTSRTQHCAAGYTGAKPLDECASGTSFSFTFDKTGSWGYHDHMNDDAHGTVVVQ